MRRDKSRGTRARRLAVVPLLFIVSSCVAAGPAGRDGAPGAAGLRGPPGEQGPAGETGAPGLQGSQGPQGRQGARGRRGLTGHVGATGPVGADGAAGLQGAAGPVGPTGERGPQGATGDRGATGDTGETGPMGEKGNTGPQGVVGPAGPQGAQGPQGEQGPAGIQGVAGGFGAHGSFYDTTTVPLPQSQSTPVPLNTTDFADGVSIVSGSQITFAVAGKFSIMFSSQLEKGDAGTDLVSVWLRKNGLNIPWTNTDVVITSSGANSRHLIAFNFFIDVAVGDFFQLMMTSTTSSQMVIRSLGPQTNPTRPEIPSTILTVNQVG